jgi:hypothetical protein
LLLELELELLLELELELELELLLELELELELELLLELLLWFELELLLWFELELLLWFELELLLWFELVFDPLAAARLRRLIVRWFRLIVRRFCTARARHQSIDFPSIFRSMGTEARAGAREIGATRAWRSSDRDGRGSRAAPTAMPRAPSAPAYIDRIFLFSNGIVYLPFSWRARRGARRRRRDRRRRARLTPARKESLPRCSCRAGGNDDGGCACAACAGAGRPSCCRAASTRSRPETSW